MHFLTLFVDRIGDYIDDVLCKYNENTEMPLHAVESEEYSINDILTYLPLSQKFMSEFYEKQNNEISPRINELLDIASNKAIPFRNLPFSLLLEIGTKILGQHYDEDGNFLSTWNDNAEFDYYNIGGCWSKFLVSRTGERFDVMKAKDIDWDATFPDKSRPLAIVLPNGEWKSLTKYEKHFTPDDFDIQPNDTIITLDCHM